MPNDVSANQAYTLPHPDNVARDDATRIRDALNAIDADVSGALASILTLATIAYVDQRFTDLTGAAPAALDTLVELASALADDANFAAAMTTALAGKSDTGHGHAIADVTALQAALDGKSLSGHTHAIATQAAAEAGSGAGFMDPLRTAQAILVLGASGVVGGGLIWFGNTPAPGHLETDGVGLDTTLYADLFAAYGYTFGGSGTTFNIPDFRGEFLRIWDHGRGADPDAASRTDRGDGTTGDNVGTKQSYDVQSHRHSVGTYNPGGWGSGYNKAPQASPYNAIYSWNSNYTGGNETRGRNANIMLCIKY